MTLLSGVDDDDDGDAGSVCRIDADDGSPSRWNPCGLKRERYQHNHNQPHSYASLPPRLPHTLELEEGRYVVTFCDLEPIPEEHEGPVTIRTAVRCVTPRNYYH